MAAINTTMTLIKGALFGQAGLRPLISVLSRYQHQLPSFETLSITTPQPKIVQVEVNRPKKLNAFSRQVCNDLTACFNALSEDPSVRVVVIAGSGESKAFTAGLDLMDLQVMMGELQSIQDMARRSKSLRKTIKDMQAACTALEACSKPVLAAVHGACIGIGVDLIAAADCRYSTADAYFQIREVEIGLAADVGTLQRVPRIIGSDGLVRELVYTARKVPSQEAKDIGLVNQVYPDRDTLIKEVLKIASNIASKTPVAVQGSKLSLNYSRDHSIQDGLDQIATWNQAMLQTEDLLKAAMAIATKSEEPPEYEDF